MTSSTRPPNKPPEPPKNPKPPKKAAGEQLLADIDCALIGLLATAYFSPTVRNTSASVAQVCAAEVLLHRLRAARRAVRELAEAYGIESPARRDHVEAGKGLFAIATNGGPVQTPSLVGPGERERPAPGLAAAIRCAARESSGAVVAPGAGADFRLPRDIRDEPGVTRDELRRIREGLIAMAPHAPEPPFPGTPPGPPPQPDPRPQPVMATCPEPPWPEPPPGPPGPPPPLGIGALYDALPPVGWVYLPEHGIRVRRVTPAEPLT